MFEELRHRSAEIELANSAFLCFIYFCQLLTTGRIILVDASS